MENIHAVLIKSGPFIGTKGAVKGDLSSEPEEIYDVFLPKTVIFAVPTRRGDLEEIPLSEMRKCRN